MTVYDTTREVEWDLKDDGEFAKLEVTYEWDTDMDTLVVYSVRYGGLEWIDYLNDKTREYLTTYINERLEP
jgi:hypothetical protein